MAKAKGLIKVVEKKLNRIIVSVFLGVMMLVNTIFASIAVHDSPSGMNGALAFQIVLSILTIILCITVLWRGLDQVSHNSARFFYALCALMSVIWMAAFLSLVIQLIRVPNSLDGQGGDGSKGGDNNKMLRLLVRADSKNGSSFHGAIGCCFFSIATCGLFIFNTIYIHVRYRMLYPKYSQLEGLQGATGEANNDIKYPGDSQA